MRDHRLFEKISSHEYVRRVPLMVTEQMVGWPDELFDSTDLDSKVAALKREANVNPILLRYDQRTGKRRQESFSRDDGWGGSVNHTYDVIDISIPFEGDDVCFTISPSTKTLGASGRILQGCLVISLPDDDRLETDLKAKVDVIVSNLHRVNTDLASLATAVDEAMRREIGRRKDANQVRRDRDSRRSFPIE